MKNSNGSARRNFFRSSSRRLRAGPTGTPTAAANGTSVGGSLIAGGQVGGPGRGGNPNKKQAIGQQQQSSPIMDQSGAVEGTNQQSGQLAQQTGHGRHNSPSEFGGSSSGGFTYFSDSSNQGDTFTINANNPPVSGNQQYSTEANNTTLMALDSPSSNHNGNNNNIQAQQQQARSQAPNQQQPQYQSMKNTPPPAQPIYVAGGPPPPQQQHTMMMSHHHQHHAGPPTHLPHQHQPLPQHLHPQQQAPQQHMGGPGPMQPAPGMGLTNLLAGHPQGPSVVQW